MKKAMQDHHVLFYDGLEMSLCWFCCYLTRYRPQSPLHFFDIFIMLSTFSKIPLVDDRLKCNADGH
jgi:hypothetical protein